MAFKVPYILIADTVQTDVGQNKVNILGVFDTIYTRELPTVHAGLVVVALIAADTEDELGTYQASLRFVRPNGQTIGEATGNLRFEPGGGGTWLAAQRLVIGIQGLPLREHGRHRIELRIAGDLLAEHPLRVAPAQTS